MAGSCINMVPMARDQDDNLLYYVYTKAGNSIDEIMLAKGVART